MAPRTSVARGNAEYDVAGASAAYRSAQEALIERNNIPGGLRLLEELMVRRGLPPWIEGSARADMGTALSMIGRRDEAVAQFEHSLRFQPQRPLTFYNLGLSYGELGRAEEAVAASSGASRPSISSAQGSVTVRPAWWWVGTEQKSAACTGGASSGAAATAGHAEGTDLSNNAAHGGQR